MKVELKRFRVVKEVGRIVMNVRIFACYQLIEVCQVSYLFCFCFQNKAYMF